MKKILLLVYLVWGSFILFARQCPTQSYADGGMGVLKARALCISLLKEYYEDPQSCNSFQEIIERSANNKLLNFEMVALPNPTSDELVVQWSQPLTNDGNLYLADINGKVVLSNTINKGAMNHKIFLQHLSGGIYYIRLHSEGIQSTPLKVIVIH